MLIFCSETATIWASWTFRACFVNIDMQNMSLCVWGQTQMGFKFTLWVWCPSSYMRKNSHQILGWKFFLQSWQFLLRTQLRQPRRQRCPSVGAILAPPSTIWPRSPPTPTSTSTSSRTPSSPSSPRKGPWRLPRQTISSIPKCEQTEKLGKQKNCSMHFSLTNYNLKILCVASDRNFSLQTQIKHMSRKCQG